MSFRVPRGISSPSRSIVLHALGHLLPTLHPLRAESNQPSTILTLAFLAESNPAFIKHP